jgi:uncharacterized protein (DUF1330 family)
MKAKYALIMLGGFALGAAAVQTLNAAGTPPAFVVGQITVKDENSYKNEFLPMAQKGIKESGGKYVAGGFNKTVTFDGPPPSNRVVIIQFESMDAAKAWNDNPTNKESRKIGDKYATFQTFAVEGIAP